MKNTDNTFFICERWMVDELGLKGIDLMLFALLYGFASGSTGSFWGSRDFLAQWVGCSTASIDRHLALLESKGYIERRHLVEDGIRKITYIVNRFPGDTAEDTADAAVPCPTDSNVEDTSDRPQTPSDLTDNDLKLTSSVLKMRGGSPQNEDQTPSKRVLGTLKMRTNNNIYNNHDNDMDNTAQGAGAQGAGAQGARKRGRGKAAEDGGCGESERRTEGQGYVKGEGDARSAARRRGRYAGDRRRTDSDAAERRRGTISSFDTDDFFEAAVRRSFKNLDGD